MWGLWFAIGIGAAAVLGAVAWAFRRPEADDPEWRAAFDATQAQAQADPRKAWAAAVYPLTVGEADPGARPKYATALLAGLGITDAVSFERAVAELAGGDDSAWPLVRAIALWRVGVGRGWCADDQAWGHIWPLCRALQARYSDFEHLAADYLRGLRAAGRPEARAHHTEQTVITLRAEVWPEVAYGQAI